MENLIKKEEIDENGCKYEYYENKEGNLERTYKIWHKNGNKQFDGKYKNGKYEGIVKRWFENGNKYVECEYRNNKLDGIYKSWYKNGNKYKECAYKNDKQEGIYNDWYSNGNKCVECEYRNNNVEGICKGWYENGNIEEQKYFIKNKIWRDMKNNIHGWKVLTKLINNRKERRMKRLMINIKNKISQINDCLVYSLIMEYVSWKEKNEILEKYKLIY
jgi:antitoxin component YwqK of YwqJK toxin-antitoxin module